MSVVFEICKKLSDDIDLSSGLYKEFFKNLKQYQLLRSINRDDPNSCLAYAQGWFLKPRFFKKKCTFYLTDDKENMLRFFRKYGDFHKERCTWRYDPGNYKTKELRDGRALETMLQFDNAWADNCVFIVAF